MTLSLEDTHYVKKFQDLRFEDTKIIPDTSIRGSNFLWAYLLKTSSVHEFGILLAGFVLWSSIDLWVELTWRLVGKPDRAAEAWGKSATDKLLYEYQPTLDTTSSLV